VTEYLKYLASQIETERKKLIENLGEGVAKDHGEYKHICGTVRGLLIANSFVEDLVRKLEQSDE